MRLSFRTKLLASHVGLVFAVGIISIFILNRWMTDDLVRQLDQRLEEQAKGATEWADEGGRRHPEKIVARIAHIVDAEVTLFDPQGNVLAASTKEAATDVGPEVQSGHASRMRGGQEFHYVAVRGADGNVLRLAVPLSDVNETVAAMRRRLLFASALAVLLALALGFLAARVASRPLGDMTETASRLARGDFDVPIEAEGTDEFGVLWSALKSLAQQLKARIGELVAERDRLSAILAGMVEGVLVVDEAGAIVVANPAAHTILGTELTKKTLAEAVTNDEIRAHIASGHESELEVVDRRGTSIAVYVRRLPDGATVAVLRDLTALRKLMTLRRDFVANVSHELRTPVTSIQGYAETLLEGKVDAATQRQFLEIVHRQAQRIGLLVEQLLALSEIEARDREAVAREPVAIADVARHVEETVRGRTKLAIDVAAGIVARADREGLERAVLNLVDNAIKYGGEAGAVRIGAAKKDGRVVLTVADDGPGIAPEHLPRLFERFYRVDPGRSRQHGGAGLGLSIVKHLVESMDGEISVASELGKGTSFRIVLPTGS